ncbi:MAG: hypothetical protein HOJ34_01890 [Kordiimonadaceae bacterium]|jgi:uncharacterized membrane protein YkvI|nr:hypothetical protein [Kordiimonadaceae bacterium]MBT6037279.1 hypothetical protein [Kordiimonadaceae bacterium]MBT6328508.1 hypothetical protein [Kordiimonadaceae bacterium]MBT7581702.1 hypothetical protein [Kordiimonadaceae bacterium]
MSDFFQKYLLPGFIFQSVIIGGGYATGREIVEFFMSVGPLGGVLGIFTAMIVWSLTLAISFELARRTKSYDYQSFFSHLLGRFAILFEISYFLLVLLIVAVLGAAAGELISLNFSVSILWGTVGLMITVGVLVFYGSSLIEKFLSLWSILLYISYGAFFIFCVSVFGDKISANFAAVPIGEGWFKGGMEYSGYGLACMPAVLFCIRHLKTRKQAITAGLLAGPIAMIPALLFFIVMCGYYPEIIDEPLPVNFLLAILDSPLFKLIFQIILFGTFIETGTALIHSLNERIAMSYVENNKIMPRLLRPAVAIVILLVAAILAATFGIVNLVANGYGNLTYAFIILLILPLFTIGLWKIFIKV